MTITFENNNDVIVYALEKIIAYARRPQLICVAQCVWWLASVIGLEQGLVTYIDNIQSRIEVKVTSVRVPQEPAPVTRGSVSPQPRDIQEDQRQDRILKECEEYLNDSRQLREIASLKAKGRTSTGLINPTPISKKYLRKKDRVNRKQSNQKSGSPKTEGIESSEIERRKIAGECLRCAWPSDRKGTHRVKDCV
jgi:hypothetical protein